MAAAMEVNLPENIEEKEEKERKKIDKENIKSLNQIINLFDPPKDLNVGPYLSQTKNGETLKNIIMSLFIKEGESIPSDIKRELIGVGDKKESILKRIANKYNKQNINEFPHLDIMREKSPVGSDTKPSKLFLLQDNGPLDVVEQPTLILTAGSILDPAGKTKTRAKYLIMDYPYLQRSWIEELAMDPAFNESPVSVSTEVVRRGNIISSYIITINSSIGQIIGKFNAQTFVVEENGINDDKKYFLGNNEKNKAIADLLKENRGTPSEASKNIIKKYILIKELGDTLQVQWLNTIFNDTKKVKNNAGQELNINRENTVIATTDSVVCFRSIVNKIGVIWTHQGKTTYFLPNILDKVQEEVIRRSFIENICSSVLAHNIGVIQILVDLKNNGEELIRKNPSARSVLWIQGLTWEIKSINVAIQLLEIVIEKLKSINADIANTLRTINNIDDAKNFAAKSHFTSPFIRNKDKVYIRVKTTKALINNEHFQFTTNAFTSSNCDTLVKANKFIFGTDILPSAATREGLKPVISFELNPLQPVRNQSGGDRNVIKNLKDFFNRSVKPSDYEKIPNLLNAACQRYRIDSNSDERNIAANDILLEGPDISTDAFLYCYVRDFHPEIFTFALIQRYAIEAIGRTGIEFLVTNLPNYIYLDADFSIKYLPEGTYSYKNRGIFFEGEGEGNSIKEYYKIPKREKLDEMFTVTKTAILLANIYFEHFPQVMSPYLRFFMIWIRDKLSRIIPGIRRGYEPVQTNIYIKEKENSGENVDVAMIGGDNSNSIVELLSNQPFYYEAIENAAAIHSLFFTLKTRVIYEDRFTSNNEIFEEILSEYRNINNELKIMESINFMKTKQYLLQESPLLQEKNTIISKLPNRMKNVYNTTRRRRFIPRYNLSKRNQLQLAPAAGGKTRKVKRINRRKTRRHR